MLCKFNKNWKKFLKSSEKNIYPFQNHYTTAKSCAKITKKIWSGNSFELTNIPQEMKQFRPISLCNVIYKICLKVLANRIRVFMDEIIADECIHYLKRKKGKSGACAVKLDIVLSRVTSRKSWPYWAFAEVFTQRVMKCVTIASFLVRVNGTLSNRFRPTRGII